MTSAPDDVLARLRRCLNEDEDTACDGGFDSWHTRYCASSSMSEMYGHCECDVPARVLRVVAAHRKILDEHPIITRPIYEFTGNYVEQTGPDGQKRRYFPPGSITGQQQVGTRYLCGGCERQDDDFKKWPCVTVQALIEVYADRLDEVALP